MSDSSHIREHMEVIGADGGHIGTVDHVHGDHIKLTKTDRGSGGHHHLIPLGMVADVEGEQVRMSFNSDLLSQFETPAE